MTTFLILLKRMAALLFMMGCGYFSYKKKWIGEEGYASLSKIVAQIFNPILLIYNVLVSDTLLSAGQFRQNLILVAVYFAVLIPMGFLVPFLMRSPGEEKYQENFMLVFSNTGFMAIPVLTALFGDSVTIFIIFYIFVFNILIYSYGIILIAKTKGSKGKANWKLMINSGTIGSVLAIILYATHIKLGDPVLTICNYMGNATIPLSMFLTGISIAMFPLKELFNNWRLYVMSLVKLVIIPVAAALILKHMGLDQMVVAVFVYELAMPVASLSLMMNKNYGAHEEVTSKGIVLTTILSIVTIPLVSFFL